MTLLLLEKLVVLSRLFERQARLARRSSVDTAVVLLSLSLQVKSLLKKYAHHGARMKKLL